MPSGLNETPTGDRIHIGIFGKTNSGKSSFINAFTGQNVSIVSNVAGTTTDPIYKAMEVYPVGPCVIIDTAGFSDKSSLGKSRIEKTMLSAEKTDIAILLFADENIDEELRLYWYFKRRNTPVVLVISKCDIQLNKEIILNKIKTETNEIPLFVSAKTGEGIDLVKNEISKKIPKNYENLLITGTLVNKEDVVLLVMPQDIQAPKGRLILPQVQTIRELLDKDCIIISSTANQFKSALSALKIPPKLIITDSQIFKYVYENKPKESMLTSFSVLFAAYKGDLPYYIEGAKYIDSLTEKSNVLIAECCTHAPLSEDIGREKIPNMLKKRFGSSINVDVVSGTDFPESLNKYDLIIQCGACMFNRKYVMSRIDKAKSQNVPMTNYGVAIAHLTGILDKVTFTNYWNILVV